jgi:hypothetical protein
MSLSSLELTDTLAAGVDALALQVDEIVNGGAGERVTDATITKLLTAAALLYAARVESGGDNLSATTPGALNATQGMMVTSAIMKSVNLQVFELGLWQTWSQEAVAR